MQRKWDSAFSVSLPVPRTVTKGLPCSGYREGPGFAGLLFSVFLRQASQHVTQTGLELMERLLSLPPECQVFSGSHITEHGQIQETGPGVKWPLLSAQHSGSWDRSSPGVQSQSEQ